jgi:tetratricopeptide (TPR) repeat protein
MDSKADEAAFQVAVSDREQSKIGTGDTAKTVERTIYYYAQRTPGQDILIQPLSAEFLPAGEKTPIDQATFIKRFRPEPLIYYNKVKPAMDAVARELKKGDRHLAAGRLEKAEASFKSVLEVDSDNIRAIFSLGITYLEGGNTDEALEIFNKIMSLELAFGPEHVHLFNEFGIRMRKSCMLDKALAYYRRAVNLNPGDEHLLFNMARIHFELEDFQSAGDYLRQALAINPGFAIATKMLSAVDKVTALAEKKAAQDTPPAES